MIIQNLFGVKLWLFYGIKRENTIFLAKSYGKPPTIMVYCKSENVFAKMKELANTPFL